MLDLCGRRYDVGVLNVVLRVWSFKVIILLALTLAIFIITSLQIKVRADEVKVFTAADLQGCVMNAGNVCVLQGNYYSLGGTTLDVAASVTIRGSGAPVTITGGNPVVDIRADQVVLTNVAVANGVGVGIRISGGVNDVMVQASRITSNNDTGIQIEGSGDISDLLFLDLEVRNNNGPGIKFVNTGSIGGVVINRCVVESNGPPGNLVFDNGGQVRNLAIKQSKFNYASGAPAAHGIFFDGGRDVREAEISSSQIAANNGAGIYFNNTGRADYVSIFNNQGITGNSSSNVWFGSSVKGISNLIIDSNRLDASINGSGVAFKNEGIIEDLTLSFNTIEGNNRDGVSIFNAGPLVGAAFNQNSITNNYRNGLWVNHTSPNDFRVEDLNFSENIISQNDNDGVKVETGWSSVFELRSSKDRFSKNRNYGWQILTDRGDINTVQFDEVIFDENQNGSGAELQARNASILNVDIKHATFVHNGLCGLMIRGGGSHIIDTVNSSDSTYQFNGTRSAVGGGSGFYIEGGSIYDILSENDLASNNNDHGMQVRASSVISSVDIVNGHFDENDLNSDAVGDGINIDAYTDLSSIDIQNCTAHNNNNGFNIGSTGGQISQQIGVKDGEANNNSEAGLAIISGGDLKTAVISGNKFGQNGFGIYIKVAEVGTNITISENQIKGDGGADVGISLDAGGISIYKNSVRLTGTGVLVKRSDENTINQNNIAQNSSYGIDATALAPGNQIDATHNWWGEPSGPRHLTNPPGEGDRVTDRVAYRPFLTEPVLLNGDVDEDSYFEITEFEVPSYADVDTTVTVSYKVTNIGSEEGIRSVSLAIFKAGRIIHQVSESRTVNPQATLFVDFNYTFSEVGNYTVVLDTGDDSQSAAIQVGAITPPGIRPDWGKSGIPVATGDSVEMVLKNGAGEDISDAVESVTVNIYTANQVLVKEADSLMVTGLSDLASGVYIYTVVVETDDTYTSPVKTLLVQKLPQ